MGQKLKEISNEAQDKKRIYLYDNIKFLAILLVVIGHSINFLTAMPNNHLEKSLFIIIYSVHMPLFVFVSGLFVKKMDKSTAFPKQKVIAYVLIGLALRVMMSVLRLLLGKSVGFSVFEMLDTFTWYMFAMALFISFVWLFREYNTKILLLITIIVGCMAGYDKFLGDEFALMRTIVFLPFFYIGYILNPEKFAEFLSKKWVKITGVAVIVGVVVLFLFSESAYHYLRPIFTGRNSFSVLGKYKNFGALVRLLCYGISTFFGVAIMSLVPKKKIKFISFTGTKTLQIYFWHKAFLLVFERFGVYAIISSVTGGTIATVIYILLAVGITFVCTAPIFSFPTKQLLSFGKTNK